MKGLENYCYGKPEKYSQGAKDIVSQAENYEIDMLEEEMIKLLEIVVSDKNLKDKIYEQINKAIERYNEDVLAGNVTLDNQKYVAKQLKVFEEMMDMVKDRALKDGTYAQYNPEELEEAPKI